VNEDGTISYAANAGSVSGRSDALYPKGLTLIIPPGARPYAVAPGGLEVERTTVDKKGRADSALPVTKVTQAGNVLSFLNLISKEKSLRLILNLESCQQSQV